MHTRPISRSKSKLYRFDSDANEWKERGIGQAKILQHKGNKRIRFLFRQEKTLKIRGNHISAFRGGFVVARGGSVCPGRGLARLARRSTAEGRGEGGDGVLDAPGREVN